MRALPAIAALVVAALVVAAPAGAATDPLRSKQWGLDLIESDAAHATATGAGAVVAVIDTGVLDTHPDLAGRLLPGRDFVQNDDTPQDGHGHGTHVTGIIAANEGNGIGVGSVAPGAVVMPLRVLGDDGSGDTSNVAKALDYAVAHGAQVINLSLGGDVPLVADDPELGKAMDRAIAAGVVLVAAAGNSTVPVCDQPSVQGRFLCVGAVDRHGVQSFFSNFAGNDGVMAPGGANLITEDDILSTWKDGKYQYLAGTSQATPHVSGVAALLVSLGLRGQQVVDRIEATATDAGAPGPDPEYGYGIVNARAAVAGLSKPPDGGGTGSASVARHWRTSTVLKKGVRVSCKPVQSGRCSARVRSGSTTIAYGYANAAAGRTTTVVARVTKAGKKLLNSRRHVTAKVEIALPGSPTRVKTIGISR